MNKIAVFGVKGMLGNAVYNIFNQAKYDIISIDINNINAEKASTKEINKFIGNSDYIINCIGIIKPYINDNNPLEIERAIKVNSLFPHILSQTGIKNIQIATDCVFDGLKGNYSESDKHNALDVYGKTKSLGEVQSKNFMNLRCSIIGPEIKNKKSLLEWFINQPLNSTVNGFKNHFWNGITTYAFAKICKGIIDNEIWFDGLQHIIPLNTINKADMLKIFAKEFNRNDINIIDINATEAIDRTICTLNSQRNKQLWKLAGYNQIPTIEELIKEIKTYA